MANSEKNATSRTAEMDIFCRNPHNWLNIWKWLDFKYVKNKCALQVMLFVSQNMYQFTSAERLSGQYYEVNIML